MEINEEPPVQSYGLETACSSLPDLITSDDNIALNSAGDDDLLVARKQSGSFLTKIRSLSLGRIMRREKAEKLDLDVACEKIKIHELNSWNDKLKMLLEHKYNEEDTSVDEIIEEAFNNLSFLFPNFQERYRLERRNPIGIGTTASIHLISDKKKENRREKSYFIAKRFRLERNKQQSTASVKKCLLEWAIHSQLEHPNIVKIHSACFAEANFLSKTSYLCLIQDYCSHGDLLTHLLEKHLTQDDKNCFLKQILQAIAYVHSKGIAHLDIKPDNILLAPDGRLQLTDFGTSVLVSPEHYYTRMKTCRGMSGTFPYAAPEVNEDAAYSGISADLFSTGVLLFTLFCESFPFQKASIEDTHYSQLSNFYEALCKDSDAFGSPETFRLLKGVPSFRLFHSIPLGAKRIIMAMMHPNPSMRPDITVIRRRKWVQQINCCCDEDQLDTPELVDVSLPIKNLKGLKLIHHHALS